MWEIVVAFLPQIVQFCLLVLGVYVSLRPPRKEHHVRFIICFCVLGVVGIVLTTWEQRSLGSQLNAIQKNTEQPVKFTVNVPPPTVQLLPPSNEKVTRRTGEALFVDCSLAVLPKKVTSDRVYVLQLFPLPIANGHINLGEYYNSTGEFNWEGFNARTVYRCRITNYMDRPISNLEMRLLTWYFEVVREGGNTRMGQISLARDWPLTSLKLMWDQKMPSFFISGIRVTRLPDSPSPIKQLFNSLVKPRGRLH